MEICLVNPSKPVPCSVLRSVDLQPRYQGLFRPVNYGVVRFGVGDMRLSGKCNSFLDENELNQSGDIVFSFVRSTSSHC